MAREKGIELELLRGFEEYLPHEQLQFNALIDIIRRNYELFGFLPIETPSAERVDVLTSKGGVEKEIYALTRLAATSPDDDTSVKGALRFDLTVPLARYVAMRERELAFPFRRYQIQRVWRGETPQTRKGRFREFYQCDIDIINRNTLSYLAEAEIPSVIYSVFDEMGLGRFKIRINNRKVLRGILEHFNVNEARAPMVLRVLDKVEREGRERIASDLVKLGLPPDVASALFELVSTGRSSEDTLAYLHSLPNSLCSEGAKELESVVSAIGAFGVPSSAFAIDLSVVRGLDYYTGTIYETTLLDHPEVGSICSGGRYDDLASYFTNTKLPGVGISIGLTRLFAKLKEIGHVPPVVHSPAEVLITMQDRKHLKRYLELANDLRRAQINTEVYLEDARLTKQLEYANKKKFLIVIIAGDVELAHNLVQIKELRTNKDQMEQISNVVSVLLSRLNILRHS